MLMEQLQILKVNKLHLLLYMLLNQQKVQMEIQIYLVHFYLLMATIQTELVELKDFSKHIRPVDSM